MTTPSILDILKNTDIYLIDQILKNRYGKDEIILDAGCGSGRNLNWFYQNNYKLIALDLCDERIEFVKDNYPSQQNQYIKANLNAIPLKDNSINHIISCAVLHFSQNTQEFNSMWSELTRVLKPGGTLFVRTASNIGIENHIEPLKNGIYKLKDDTLRYLLTEARISKLLESHPLELIEPIKTTNVHNMRAMSTIVLKKTM